MRWLFSATLCLLLCGCVASTEVKQASSQVGVALAELQKAQANLRNVYIRELEEVRELAGRSIVAAAVVNKVGTLKEEEIDGDLIEISRAIGSERAAYRELVSELLAARPKPGEPDEQAVIDILVPKRVKGLRDSADALESAGMADSAEELRAKADALERDPSSLDRDGHFDDMVNIMILAATQDDVRAGLEDLEQYIGLLRMMHTEIDEWIATDVTVKGDDIATLIQNAEKTFGSATGGTP